MRSRVADGGCGMRAGLLFGWRVECALDFVPDCRVLFGGKSLLQGVASLLFAESAQRPGGRATHQGFVVVEP